LAIIHCPSQTGSQDLFDKVNKATCFEKYIFQGRRKEKIETKVKRRGFVESR
jgi:hypothetical protein